MTSCANLLASPSLLQEMKRQDPDFPDVSSGVFVYEVIQGTAAERSVQVFLEFRALSGCVQWWMHGVLDLLGPFPWLLPTHHVCWTPEIWPEWLHVLVTFLSLVYYIWHHHLKEDRFVLAHSHGPDCLTPQQKWHGGGWVWREIAAHVMAARKMRRRREKMGRERCPSMSRASDPPLPVKSCFLVPHLSIPPTG